MLRLLRYLLLPFTAIYSLVVLVRNVLFDLGLLKSRKGPLPSVVIGNLSTGGTGKTPHTEYIAKLISPHINMAFLSRGYGRSTKGFVLADSHATSSAIGDEPMQIHLKFPKIPFAVCEDRLHGIHTVHQLLPEIQLVLLDDAYQHRWLKPDLSIVLTDYNQPYWDDITLPTGNLRDNVRELHRADILMVTKCPADLSADEKKEILGTIDPAENQRVFFSTIQYAPPVHFSGPDIPLDQQQAVIGLCGIASPQLFMDYLSKHFKVKESFVFRDHHIFSHSEVKEIYRASGNFDADKLPVITTEKDAMRLTNAGIESDVPMYYIPIEVRILDDEALFNEYILGRVKKLTSVD